MESPENRYAPPKALELELPPQVPADRCLHVDWACTLLWTGFGVSVASSLLTLVATHDSRVWAKQVLGLFGLAFGLVIVDWVTRKLRAGRNGMRLLVTIFNSIGSVGMAISVTMLLSTQYGRSFLSGFFGAAPIPSISLLLHTAFGAAEIVLLNTPSSRAWFRAKKFSG